WGLPFPKGQGTAPRRPSPAGSPGRVSKDVANLPPGGAGPSTTNGEPPRFRRWAYHREGSAGAGAGLVRLRSPAGAGGPGGGRRAGGCRGGGGPEVHRGGGGRPHQHRAVPAGGGRVHLPRALRGAGARGGGRRPAPVQPPSGEGDGRLHHPGRLRRRQDLAGPDGPAGAGGRLGAGLCRPAERAGSPGLWLPAGQPPETPVRKAGPARAGMALVMGRPPGGRRAWERGGADVANVVATRRRSDMIKRGIDRAPHRSLLRAAGVREEDFDKPFIAVVNSYVDIVPGHVHLQAFGQLVKEAIREAGGVPFEFNTIGVDDGIAMGHLGMRYSLPSRELIADSVETMVTAHWFDGMICIPNCDKITPGMMMAAMRLDIPTIFISGGPMRAGRLNGRAVDLISVFEAVGGHQAGRVSDEELLALERVACPGCGSCSGMFTANSMNCLAEALGLALPGNGTILADTPEREALAREAARRIVELVEEGLTPRQLVTLESLDNAFALDMAMGGSTNTVLHGLAIAHEAGIEYPLERLDALSRRVPHLCKVSPASSYHIEDVH